MHKAILASITVVLSMSGCSQAATLPPSTENQAARDTMLEVAKQAARAKQSSLVAFAESTVDAASYAVFVTYSPANEDAAATCRLQIIENDRGRIRVVEETDHLLFCSNVVDAEVEQKQLSLVATKSQISLHEQRDKTNSTFEFVKSNSVWVVSKASFNYPEQNVGSAEVEVIHEEGAFPGSLAKTRVSEFDASSARLIRKTIR